MRTYIERTRTTWKTSSSYSPPPSSYPLTAKICFATFATARIAHSLVYINQVKLRLSASGTRLRKPRFRSVKQRGPSSSNVSWLVVIFLAGYAIYHSWFL